MISSTFGSTDDSTGNDLVALWNGETTASFRHETTVVSAAVSPDEEFLATGGWNRSITLWSLETEKPIRVLTGHTVDIHALAFSPDGRLLVSSVAYKWEYLESEDGSTLRRNGHCAVHSDGDGSVSFYSADDSQSDTTAKVWEVKSGKNIATLGHQQKVTDIAYSPDGGLLASGGYDNAIYLWDVEIGD